MGSPEKITIDDRAISQRDFRGVMSTRKPIQSQKITALFNVNNIKLDVSSNCFSNKPLNKKQKDFSTSIVKNSSKGIGRCDNSSLRNSDNHFKSTSIEEKSKTSSSKEISVFNSVSKSPNKNPILSVISNTKGEIPKDQINKRKMSINNGSFSIDSLLNFEIIKNFTNIEFQELKFGEFIYASDISKVYKGEYLFIQVAIKEFDISKFKDEDMVF